MCNQIDGEKTIVKRERLIAIKEFSFRRDVLPYLLGAVGVTLSVATQIWDGLVAVLVALAIVGSNLLRRIEWRGHSLSSVVGDRSIFTEGLRALPYDVMTLGTASAVFPASGLNIALVFQTTWAWVGLVLSCIVALGAALALALEMLRRRL